MSPAGGSAPDFATRLIAWQREHGRHDLPWQGTRDAYRIWLSEIMLQQTQVATVIPFYRRFTQAFPDVAGLADAPLERVLELWSGLGYYRRARHLHAAARAVMTMHGGVFPTDAATLQTLPGVGRSTAAAVAVFSSGERAAILDGNVKRVLSRHQAIAGDPGSVAVLARLWALAEELLPDAGIEAYTQGLMDLGATICTRSRPACGRCPLAGTCAASAAGQTAAYPGRRARRVVPQRLLAPLLIVDGDGRVLLQRRPDTGIWAGLWGLPECARAPATAEDVLAHARELLGGSANFATRPRALPAFEHALTHFRLSIEAWRIDLATPVVPALVAEPVPVDGSLAASAPAPVPAPAPAPVGGSWRWLATGEAATAALPQPVRALLLAVAAAVNP
jgi:A/G-specific adenine glycosylase